VESSDSEGEIVPVSVVPQAQAQSSSSVSGTTASTAPSASDSGAERRSSGRGARVKSKAKAARQNALDALRKRQKGSMTGLASSSDSESDSGGSGSDSESDSESEVVDMQLSKQRQKPKQKKQKPPPREAPWGMAQHQNAKRDFLDRFSTDRKIRDPSPAYESDDNMDNFIVEDNEEDENEYGEHEEEEVAVDTRKRIYMASDDESDVSSQEEDETFEPEVKVGDSKKKAKREREREKERMRAKERAKARKRSNGGDSVTKRKKVVMVGSDDDDDDDDVGNDNDSESGEEMSGPAMYWQVDAMLDKKKDELTRARGHSKRHHSRQEAMHLYLEMLARAHVQKDFSMDDAEAYKYAGAVKQIEDIICTTRESLLGSGAWNREYTQHMQTRPFFTVAFKEEDRDMVPCAACHRKSKWQANGSEPPIRTVAYMYGTGYDARRVWNSARWPEYMPQDVFMWRSGEKLRRKKRKLKQLQKKQQLNEDGSRSGNETDDSGIIEVLRRNKGKGDCEGEDSSQLENVESESESDGASDDSASDDGGLDEEDEEELEAAKWWLRKWPQDLLSGKDEKFFLGGACTSRSQMYHNLLHYKFRLLYRVRGKLEAHKGDVDALMSDLKFVKDETGRFARMLDLAGRRYGGAEQVNGISGTDIWNDSERSVYTASETPAPNQGRQGTPMCLPSAPSSSSSSLRVLSTTPSQITQWLVRK